MAQVDDPMLQYVVYLPKTLLIDILSVKKYNFNNFFHKVCLYRFEYRVHFNTVITLADEKVTKVNLKNS